ncbi:hypothetical protein PG985_009178 [Apiospora marii]|uniref:Uncharacterized protein n=1 Tax=Apiospora marii TaxID=335849 RepID=A0ABR1RAI7_9PEZI
MASVSPVSRDGFAFANGDLYAEASGHNRHRRATLAELETHFRSGSEKDHPAHWFEAQLLHYGLPPSKTKAVARMRLFDAVNKANGGLKVPAHISKLESELKKEWTKLDREAKKAFKSGATAAGTSARLSGTKRKAEENVDVTVNVGGINITVSKGTSTSTAQDGTKRAKTTAAALQPATPKQYVEDKASLYRPKTGMPKPKTAPSPISTRTHMEDPAPQGRKMQTARKFAHKPVVVLSDDSGDDNRNISPRRMQTARKFSHHPVGALGHGYSSGPVDRYNEPPPPYTEHASFDYSGPQRIISESSSSGSSSAVSSSSDQSSPRYRTAERTSSQRSSSDDSSPVRLESLGLLNGRYGISCPYVSEQWPRYGEDFELVLTLAGRNLWGNFNLGVIRGVFFLDERPYRSSHNELSFIWRGREDEGPIIYGNSNRGRIKFLGGGRVEGRLDYQGIEFYGERLPGQSMTSDISPREMEREFEGFNEDDYDRESRARWR